LEVNNNLGYDNTAGSAVIKVFTLFVNTVFSTVINKPLSEQNYNPLRQVFIEDKANDVVTKLIGTHIAAQ